MLSYGFLFYSFHTLNWLALGSSLFLLIIYQRAGQNVLLRSICSLLIILYLLIESSFFILGPEPYEHPLFQDFSIIQAIVLNYCFLSIQAHACCIMVNNCFLALGWNSGEWSDLLDRSLGFLLFSYGLPILPTIALGMFIPEEARNTSFPFYSFVPAKFMFGCCSFWLLIFCALPGNLATIYLMYKAFSLRRETMGIASHSAITKMQLFRLFVVILVYSLMSLGSALSLLYINAERFTCPDLDAKGLPIFSPWKNQGMCTINPEDDDFMYFYNTRWPHFLTFLPPLMGLGVFLMYGFGTPVRNAIRQFSLYTDRVLCRPKRKLSVLPPSSSDLTETDFEGTEETTGPRKLSSVAEEDVDDAPIPSPSVGQRRRMTAPSV